MYQPLLCPAILKPPSVPGSGSVLSKFGAIVLSSYSLIVNWTEEDNCKYEDKTLALDLKEVMPWWEILIQKQTLLIGQGADLSSLWENRKNVTLQRRS